MCSSPTLQFSFPVNNSFLSMNSVLHCCSWKLITDGFCQDPNDMQQQQQNGMMMRGGPRGGMRGRGGRGMPRGGPMMGRGGGSQMMGGGASYGGGRPPMR